MRASAIRSRLPPRLASGLPNAVRARPRRHAASSAASARPISRMQWCTRPGPSRPWAIENASPGPAMMLATGTRTSVNDTSPCPSGSSAMPIVVSMRSTFTPGASVGTSTIVCRWCRSASGSVEAHEDDDLAVAVADAGGPPLASVDDHLVAVDDCGGLHVGRVGGGHAGLGHPEGAADPAVEQRLEPPLALRVGAVAQQHLHVAGVRGVAVEHQRRDRGPAGQLGDRRVVDVGQPLAAVGAEPGGVLPRVLLGQEEVPQALLAGLGLELLEHRQRRPRVAVAARGGQVAVVVRLDRLDLLGHERGHAAGQVGGAAGWGRSP